MSNKLSLAIGLMLLAFLSMQCNEDLCEFINCQNGGNCIEESCECATGYTGKFCEERLYLLKTITYNEQTTQNFTYDEMNRIIERNQFFNNNTRVETKYTYLEDTIKVRLIDLLGQDTVYHFLIDQSEFRMDHVYVDNFSNYLTRKYFNIDSNCGYFNAEFYRGSNSFTPGSLSSYQQMDYFGNCSLIIKSYRAENDTLISSRELIMDGSNSIYQSAENRVVDFNLPYVTNKKNIQKDTRFKSNGEINLNGSYESSFITNEDDYPLSETRTFLTGEVWEITYEYY